MTAAGHDETANLITVLELPMTSLLADVRDTLVPDLAGPHGPLPPLLISMTLVTGLVDAVSYLTLGHVFVANMTGNVVFLGFALAGAPGFSVGASLTALAAFAAGALVGGRVTAWHRAHRGRQHSTAAGTQAGLLAVAVVVAALGAVPLTAPYRYALIVALGLAMGVQNAAARKLAIPDLTTTVLTLTITGLAADSRAAGGPGGRPGRRLLSVVTMLGGALIGAALVLHTRIYYPLVIAFVVIVAGAATSRVLGRSDPDWTSAPAPSGPAAPGPGAPSPNAASPH
jgi:uncharacterized membrane protein YoaK (UPF0700 family)